jgi:teichuronic acid exporter
VIRLLAPSDYGLMAMVLMFMSFLFMVSELGAGGATVQAKTLEPDDYRRMFGLVLTTNFVGFVIAFAAAPLVASLFSEPRLVLVARVLGLNFVFAALIALPQAEAIRRLDFETKSKVDVAATMVGTVASLGLAIAGVGVWALVFGTLAQQFFKAVMYQFIFPLRAWPAFSFGAIRPMMQFGIRLSLDRVIFFLQGNMAALVAGKVLGKEALGLYTVALTFAAAPLQRVLPVLTQVSFSAFARIQTDADRVRRNVLRSLRFASLLSFPALLGLAAVAPVAVPLVLGPKWIASTILVQIICLGVPLRILLTLVSPALLGTGQAGANLANVSTTLVLTTVALLVGVRFGVVGLAWSGTLVIPLVFLLNMRRSSRTLGIPAAQLVRSIVPFLLTAMVMSAAVAGLSLFLPPAIPGLPRLVILMIAGAVLYGSLIAALEPRLLQDLRALLKRDGSASV